MLILGRCRYRVIRVVHVKRFWERAAAQHRLRAEMRAQTAVRRVVWRMVFQ